MKKLIATTVLAFMIPFAAFAHSALHDNMKQLGALAKKITVTISNPANNAENALNASKMIELLQVVFTQAELGMENVPEENRQAAIIDFQNLVQQEVVLTAELQAAFAANDNNAAILVFEKINEIKRAAHDKYK